MFTDNLSNNSKTKPGEQVIPAITRIYYSKPSAVRHMVIAAVVVFICLLSMIAFGGKSPAVCFFGCFLIIFSLIVGISRYGNYRNKTPQIYLDNEGMQTVSIPFFYWRDIKGEDVSEIRITKTKDTYLVYEHPKGVQRFPIALLDTTKEELLALLKVYRERSEEKN